MSSNTTNKKCPRCGRKRKFIPSSHGYASGREWHYVDGKRICAWCFARREPDGEKNLRAEQAALRKQKKDQRKKDNALKVKDWWKGATQL